MLWETVSPAHMLLALALNRGPVGAMLQQQGVDPEAVRKHLPVGSSVSDRVILDIEFDAEARIMMSLANTISESDDTHELMNAHVLKALLLEDAVCSVVSVLTSLYVSVETLRRRTDIILKLSKRSPPEEVAIQEPKLVVSDVFDEETVLVIEAARNAAGAQKQSLVRMDHLLSAFVKLGYWREYVNELITFVRSEHLFYLNIIPDGGKDADPVDFSDEFKHVLLSARELRNVNSHGLIEPLMLLYGMAQECSSDLFTEDTQDKLSMLTRTIREDILGKLEKREVVGIESKIQNFPTSEQAVEQLPQESVYLMLTERLVRVIRFAKAEAALSRQTFVEASHLVLAMIRESFFSEIAFVKERVSEIEKLRADVCRDREIPDRPIGKAEMPSAIRLTPESRGLLLLARDQARELRLPYIDLNHLAIALLRAEVWLRNLVDDSQFSNSRALVKRLQQCSFQQYHTMYGHSFDADLPDWLHLTLDEIDELESLSPFGPSTPAADSIEERLDLRSEVVMGYAVEMSRAFKHSQTSVETIMLGLLYETLGSKYDAFTALGLNFLDAHSIIARTCCGRISERTAALRPLSRNASRLIKRAWRFAQLMKSNRISPEHILLAIAEESKGVASFVCEALSIDAYFLRAELLAAMHASKKGSEPRPAD